MTLTSRELLERFISNQKPNTQKRYRTALAQLLPVNLKKWAQETGKLPGR